MSETATNAMGKLGFGLMRLPRKIMRTDIEHTAHMVDAFLEAGFSYFDTAHVYPGSEEAMAKALVQRHPRESYTVASKLYAPLATSKRAAHKQFDTTLQRTGMEYLDYYLLHSLTKGNYRKYDRFDLWNFVQQKKDQGLVRHIGFSFHSGPKLLDQILTEHREVDFVQLQLNYADWENPKVTSRANYEVARAHGVPIVVMEPVKSGNLANPPRAAADLMRTANSNASYASWAIRFAAGLEGVMCVLSGMSNMEQMKDNISFMRDFKPLDETERKVIQQVQVIMGDSTLVACTNCRYCVDGCSANIPIPEVLDALNVRLGGYADNAQAVYCRAVADKGHASDCIQCGKCEVTCTQGLDIIERLKQASVAFG